MIKRISKILVLAIALLVSMLVSNAQSPPQPDFHQFYGNVNGASPGDEVKAIVNDIVHITVVDSNNKYGINPLFLVSGGNDGDTVFFFVKNEQVKTFAYEKAGVTQLHLSYPLPSPPPSSGGSRGSGGYYPYPPSVVPAKDTADQGGGVLCFDDWICDKWTSCINGMRKRECIFNDDTTCVMALETPVMEEQCGPLPPKETCYDGIRNQGEIGIDCGEPCPPCIIEQPKPVVVEKKAPWWIYTVIGLLVLGAIIFSIIYFQRRGRFEPGTLVDGHLESYIKQTLKSGFEEKSIADRLIKEGWTKKDVEKMIKKAKKELKAEQKTQ